MTGALNDHNETRLAQTRVDWDSLDTVNVGSGMRDGGILGHGTLVFVAHR